jgi:dihydroorotate dehydrogenase (NAD+) catalytic subunit
MGGISSGGDVRDFVAAGASAVALGTILFSDPWAPARVRSELAESVPREGRMLISKQ